MSYERIYVRATAETSDGRTVLCFASVSNSLYEDTPALEGYLLDRLEHAFITGEPPGNIDASTLVVQRLTPLVVQRLTPLF